MAYQMQFKPELIDLEEYVPNRFGILLPVNSDKLEQLREQRLEEDNLGGLEKIGLLFDNRLSIVQYLEGGEFIGPLCQNETLSKLHELQGFTTPENQIALLHQLTNQSGEPTRYLGNERNSSKNGLKKLAKTLVQHYGIKNQFTDFNQYKPLKEN